MKFLAHVHSVIMGLAPNQGSKVYTPKFEPPKEMVRELERGMGAWWRE